MKNLIVLAAVLPFLLIFMLQFTLDQKNSSNMGRFQEYVYGAKEEAKQKGCFTEEIKDRLRKNVAKDFGIRESEIFISATEKPVYRVNRFLENETDASKHRGMIYYRIGVPIHKILAGHKFFGIKDEENKGQYIIDSYTASELLPESQGEGL